MPYPLAYAPALAARLAPYVKRAHDAYKQWRQADKYNAALDKYYVSKIPAFAGATAASTHAAQLYHGDETIGPDVGRGWDAVLDADNWILDGNMKRIYHAARNPRKTLRNTKIVASRFPNLVNDSNSPWVQETEFNRTHHNPSDYYGGSRMEDPWKPQTFDYGSRKRYFTPTQTPPQPMDARRAM